MVNTKANAAAVKYDGSFLTGRLLEQLALGRYEFQLNFAEEVSISFQNKLVVIGPNGAVEIDASKPAQTKELYRVHPGKGTYRDIGFTGVVFRKRTYARQAFSGLFRS